jgi:hypothetical protein
VFGWLDGAVNLLVAGVGLGAFGWGVFKWMARPRFICGVPPLASERRAKGLAPELVGRPSVARGFTHRPECFAEPFNDVESLSDDRRRELRANTNRCRTISVDPEGRATLPIIFANVGARTAENYRASVVFYSQGSFVHLVHVETETLAVSFYADNFEVLSDRLREKAIAPEIVQSYNAYLPAMEGAGDMLFLNGNLEARMHELVHVTVELEEDRPSDEFFLVFTLHCSVEWLGTKVLIQPFVLEAIGSASERPLDQPVA